MEKRSEWVSKILCYLEVDCSILFFSENEVAMTIYGVQNSSSVALL